MWELWYIGSWEKSAEHRPLWWVLFQVARPDPPPGVWPVLRGGYAAGSAITAVAVAIAGLVGFALAGRSARRAEPSAAADRGGM